MILCGLGDPPDGVQLVDPPLRLRREIALLSVPATSRRDTVAAVLAALRDPAMRATLPATRAGHCELS